MLNLWGRHFSSSDSSNLPRKQWLNLHDLVLEGNEPELTKPRWNLWWSLIILANRWFKDFSDAHLQLNFLKQFVFIDLHFNYHCLMCSSYLFDNYRIYFFSVNFKKFHWVIYAELHLMIENTFQLLKRETQINNKLAFKLCLLQKYFL